MSQGWGDTEDDGGQETEDSPEEEEEGSSEEEPEPDAESGDSTNDEKHCVVRKPRIKEIDSQIETNVHQQVSPKEKNATEKTP